MVDIQFPYTIFQAVSEYYGNISAYFHVATKRFASFLKVCDVLAGHIS